METDNFFESQLQKNREELAFMNDISAIIRDRLDEALGILAMKEYLALEMQLATPGNTALFGLLAKLVSEQESDYFNRTGELPY